LIPEAVEFYNITQVCVGRGGNPFLKRLFLGSVSKAIVESANCSVMVVKRVPSLEEGEIWTKELVQEKINCEKVDHLFTTDIISNVRPFARYHTRSSQVQTLDQVAKGDKYHEAVKDAKEFYEGHPETKRQTVLRKKEPEEMKEEKEVDAENIVDIAPKNTERAKITEPAKEEEEKRIPEIVITEPPKEEENKEEKEMEKKEMERGKEWEEKSAPKTEEMAKGVSTEADVSLV